MTTIDSWEQYRVKTCPKCGETKSMDDFGYSAHRRDGCCTYCKVCTTVYQRENRYKNRQRNKDRVLKTLLSKRYKHLYGITLEQKKELIQQQKGCCYLCDNTLPSDTRQQHIEHDKITRQVYGIACQNCNVGISYFNHDPYLMVKVAKRMLRLRKQETK